MKKLLVLAAVFFMSAVSVSAQTTILTTRCLKAVPTNPDPLHNAQLTGQGFPANTDIYVIQCVGSISDNICSANSNPTNSAGGVNTSATDKLAAMGFIMNADPKHFLNVAAGNPLRTGTGAINTTVFGTTNAGYGAITSFYGVYAAPPQPTISETATGGQKQGTFTFDGTDAGNCTTIKWDPYGRVFDSKSLEPLPYTKMELLNAEKAPYKEIGIENPQTTGIDGVFSFYVKNGSYFLDPSRTGYTYPLNQDQINSNYSKAYSNLYLQQTPIIEQSETVHVDLPMEPVGTPYHSDPKLLNYSTLFMPGIGALSVEGRVTHPFTVIRVVQGEKIITTFSADKFGYFEIKLYNKDLKPNLPIDFHLIKLDLTTNKQITTNSSFAIDPKPYFIAGIAYGKNNTVIPNAQIAVKLKMSDGIYYQTTSDQKGFIYITPDNLPRFDYYIQVTDPKTKQSMEYSTESFAQANETYLTDNHYDIMNGTSNGVPLVITASSQQSTASGSQLTPAAKQNPAGSVPGNTKPNYDLLKTIALILIGIMAFGLVCYLIYSNIRSRKKPVTSFSPEDKSMN